MTLVSQIIIDAFRQSNLLAITASPTAAQSTEALRFLNRIVKGVFGDEVGDPLVGFPIGRKDRERPAGYPWYSNTPGGEWFVPKNVRLVIDTDAAVRLFLHPAPDDGTRVAIVDPGNNLSTYPVTLVGNGNLIEGQTSLELNTNGESAEWFYRADQANWQRYSPIVAEDVFPFPEEFDDFFISMLALRLNPTYGAAMDSQSQAVFTRARTQIRARYTQDVPAHSELALIRPARVTVDRDNWGYYGSIFNPSSLFNKGWPW